MYSVVVPVYNAAATLPALVEQLAAVFAGLGQPWELILVNDGSRDASWAVIEELAGRVPQVRGLDLMRNYGQHNALLCGIRAARHPITITLDDDLQHPPAEIPRLLEALVDGVDVVFGTPERIRHGLWRGLAARVTKLALQSAMGAEIARQVSPFRAFRTHLRDAFAAYQAPFVSIDVLLTWGTSRFAAVAVRHEPRREGNSGYTLRKLITHALNMATGFSVVPLQFASWLGFACTLFGVLVLVYVVGRTLYQGGSPTPGFPFLASVIAIFSGTQLFALGIIGEYLARMHFRVMDKPAYVVRVAQGAEREA